MISGAGFAKDSVVFSSSFVSMFPVNSSAGLFEANSCNASDCETFFDMSSGVSDDSWSASFCTSTAADSVACEATPSGVVNIS